MTMFIHFFCLCPLGLTIKREFQYIESSLLANANDSAPINQMYNHVCDSSTIIVYDATLEYLNIYGPEIYPIPRILFIGLEVCII